MELRSPPHSAELERAVLGACLYEPGAYEQVEDMLTAEDFYHENHRRLWRALREVAQAGPIDPVAATMALEARGMETADEFVRDLTDRIMGTANVEAHAARLEELGRRRRLLQALQTTTERVYDKLATVEELAAALDEASSAAIQSRAGDDLVSLGEVAAREAEHLWATREQRIAWDTWGFESLDNATGGLPPIMIVVAARPGTGKTGFALEVARLSSKATGKWWLVASLETVLEALAHRMIASMGCVDTQELLTRSLDQEGWQRARQAGRQLQGIHVYGIDRPLLSPRDVLTRARRLRSRARAAGSDLGGIVVDYLQLMDMEKAENRQVQVSQASRQLATMAVQLRVPVIALSQLNRSVEDDPDKRPKLKHLRESGAIEADARLVMFLHRPGYYERLDGREVDDTRPEPVEVIIAKFNGGRVGSEKLAFVPSWTRFTELEWRQERDG